MDLTAQRRLRGQLEHIDYTVFASNREVIHTALGSADAEKFQRLAVAAALARAQWVKEALDMAENPSGFETRQVMRLAELRSRYEELSSVYEALRRMVERGYVTYTTSAT
jgi:hypothetical protein